MSVQQTAHRESSSQFTSFITSFTSFCNWLCEIHSLLLDELCVAIPDRASEDTIDVHKARLKVRVNRGESMRCLTVDSFH